MAELQPRITGTEMEWSVMVQTSPKQETALALSDEMAKQLLRRKLPLDVPRIFSGAGSWLANGARLYVDVGAHIEYAGPEDTSFTGTLANEIAGEYLLYSILEAARRDPKHELLRFNLNKRVVDEPGNRWGYHENYWSPGTAIDVSAEGLPLLGLHMATRSIFAGAGMLDQQGNFLLAQKSSDLRHSYYNGTTSSGRPLVNLRMEPHATRLEGGGRRIHVTSGDPNMSPWATIMKLGTTSLVLRLIEAGYELNELEPCQEIKEVARRVAGDISVRRPIKLKNGQQVNACDIQRELHAAVTKLRTEHQLPAEEERVYQEWGATLDDISRDPLSLQARGADWAVKYVRLEKYRRRHNLPKDSPELRSRDRGWDLLLNGKGAGEIARRVYGQAWMPSEELLVKRRTSAPTTTRAVLREKFIRHFADRPDADAGWDSVTLNKEKIFLSDPFGAKNKAVNKLIAAHPKPAEQQAS